MRSATTVPAGSRALLPRGPATRRLARLGLGVLAAAVFCAPFAAAWTYQEYRQAVAHQAQPVTSRLTANAKAAAYRDPAPGPRSTGPVVLAYHDVRPDGSGPYTLTPARLDAQLTALKAAGYRTLSSAEFVRILHGAEAPARSVYLTFDDGAQGLWQYAAPILSRHRMHAAAYLVTGRIQDHHTYYLSWPEIRRMASSGHWDFQSHTHALHHHAAVDPGGHKGAALANRLWVEDGTGPGHRETAAQYGRRVAADLDRSRAEITARGLPRPLLFSYPFSESAATHSGSGSEPSLRKMLRARFQAALTNVSPRPLPPGPRAAATGEVQRLEVTASTGVAELLRRVDHWTPVEPAATRRPLSDTGRWTFPGAPPGTRLHAFTTGRLPAPSAPSGRALSLVAAYRPVGSAGWNRYTVDAVAHGLRAGRTGLSVTVRNGSTHPVSVTVGAGRFRVTEGGTDTGGRRRTTALRHISPAGEHHVRITVDARHTRVAVDGSPPVRITAPPGTRAGDLTGGLAVGVRSTDSRHAPWIGPLTVTGTPRPTCAPPRNHGLRNACRDHSDRRPVGTGREGEQK